MKRIVIVALLLAASLAATAAQAQTGYAVTSANLRAGPDSGYPRIGGVPSGAPLHIYGCVDDWSWCDVEWRDERGWISAGLVEYEYSGRRVDLYDHGAMIGLPVLAFVLDTYWSNHYRHRSWYHERARWRGHHRQGGPPPRARSAGGGGNRALPDRGPSRAGHGNQQRSPQMHSAQGGGGNRMAQGGRPSGGQESRSAQGPRPGQGQAQGPRQERREQPRKGQGQGQGKDKKQDKDRRDEYRPY